MIIKGQPMLRKKNILVMSILVTVCVIYNFSLYFSKSCKKPITLSKTALHGQQLWQNNNCWSCHQIYGLGGYLGPDLTNVYSSQNKGPDYIKAFLNSGVKSMPKFNFNDTEKEAIVTYLKHIDSTGFYPNYGSEFQATGWVKLKYKNEK